MQHETIADLLIKHMDGLATPEETAMLDAWKDAKPGRRKQVEDWADRETLQKEFKNTYPDADTMENLRGRLFRTIGE